MNEIMPKNQDNMFYGAGGSTFQKAKMLRSKMTISEKLLWEELKANKILGLRFKAQHPIDTFIVDFYCHKLRLVIEVDGGSHNMISQREYDQGRTFDMEKHGLTVLRFTNEQVENELPHVVKSIKTYCTNNL